MWKICAIWTQAEAAKELSSFDYPPVAAVTLSYPLSAFKEERFDENGKMPGFGQLHPRSQVDGPTASWNFLSACS